MSNFYFVDCIAKKQDVEVIDLVVFSALASKCRNLWFLDDFLEVINYADYASGISFLIRAVLCGVTLWVYEIP